MSSSSTPINTSKRVAVITGCSEINSLGAAFALELLSRGWTVFATARNESTLSKLAEAGCQTLKLDVTSDESVAAAAQKVSALTGGRVDLLINNAGATGAAALLHTDPSKLAMMHDLHVLGPLRLSQAFYPYLRQTAQSGTARSKIVNIGSVISNGMPWHAAYASTKAGAQILSDVMRREFAPVKIDVITVELALVRTAMSTGAKDFPLELKDAEGSYDAKRAISTAAEDFEKDGATAPVAGDVARDIINAVERSKSPGKLYLGKNNFLFRFVIPYLPTFATDALFTKLMRVSLVKA